MYDPLQDIHHYSETLTMSQVVKFCEKKELDLSRSMIQNYIRDGLLPPPLSKRYYTHKHLAALVMIDYLKNVFGMSDIREVLAPLMDEEGLPLETYVQLINEVTKISDIWKKQLSPHLFDADKPRNISQLALMTHAADLKVLSCELIVRNAESETDD